MFALKNLAVSYTIMVILAAVCPMLEGRSKPNTRPAQHLSPPPPHQRPTPKSRTNHQPPPGNNYYYGGSTIFDVLSYGAVGDGCTDDTEAFQAAWQQACQVELAILEVPAYFTFLLGAAIFSGPCANSLTFQVDGTIIAPQDAGAWRGAKQGLLQWIKFTEVQNMVLQGDGVIDGRGDYWWSLSCKKKGSRGGISRLCDSPTAVRFYGSHNVTVQNLRIINSPQTHLKFDNCMGVEVNNVSISSPPTSPNTDGIHLQNCQNVVIKSSTIRDGDDCISIQTGTSNLNINDVHCGSGHGISIGGLGAFNSKACVHNISVHNVTIEDSQNGLRIKTWQGGSGRVKGVAFSNINVKNISNPIIIDQYYCDGKLCRNETSAVEISDVLYTSIKGTYTGGTSIHFACSEMVPCKNINVAEIELIPQQSSFLGCPFCWNAYGTSQMPSITCLQRASSSSHSHQQTIAAPDSC